VKKREVFLVEMFNEKMDRYDKVLNAIAYVLK
jgi:hypothetical protein